VSKAVVKIMVKARTGCIINIASVVGIIGNPSQANYSASKAGVIGLTKTMAKEFASRNIRANAIAPGFIQTEMTRNLPDEAKQAFLKGIPLNRPGEPEDVASVAAFLASDDAAYITGQVICVDGGMVM
jgi:3-oxoacyl-[acyl-carrier protein] reductase